VSHSPTSSRLALLRAPAALGSAGGAFALGFLSGGIPTLDAPGFELSATLAAAAALLAPAAALPAARAERARPDPSPAAAGLTAAALLLAVAAAAVVGSALRAALGPCRTFTAAAWYLPVLVVPSATLSGATAAAAAFLSGGRRLRAVLLHLLAVLCSLALTLREAWLGPAAFGHDPFLGVWPGPGVLYDEPLEVDARTLLWRAGALALGLAVLSAAEWVARRRAGRPSGWVAVALAAALAARAGAGIGLRAAGLAGDRAAIVEALGGRIEGTRCVLVHAAEKAPAARSALLAECEFHAADVARALGVVAPPRVTVYVYRSAAEKRLLTGAGRTDYVKPWHPEIHVVDAPLPHPSLRHELVHALAASLAPGPLHVPARGRVLPVSALIEGLAVALDLPRGGWTLDEYARAAREQGLLPDPVALFSAASFFGEGPARSYGTAGSFVAFVLATHGPSAVARAYADGDLARATGEDWASLARGWHARLDALPVPAGLVAAARARFGRRSAFERRCAREETALQAAAGQAEAAGRTAVACALWERAGSLGDRAAAARARGDVLARAGDLDGAEAAYLDSARLSDDDVALRAAVTAARGDLAWRRGETAAAVADWSAALESGPERAEERLLAAKRAAAADAELDDVARAYLLGTGDPAVALARLARSDHPLAAYLVGRALLARGELAAAVPELARAATGRLPPVLAREAALSLAEARCASGDPDGGQPDLERMAAALPAEADRERAAAGARRCELERGRR